MLSLCAVPKPELSHQAQAELKIPEHRAGVAIIPDADRGVTLSTPKRRHSHGLARPVADCMTRNLSCTACVCPLTTTNGDH